MHCVTVQVMLILINGFKMSKILVYGDSFAAPSRYPFGNDWPAKVAEKLGMTIENKALEGSSTDYAIKLLLEDLKNINDNDIVIFVRSTPGRLSFEFQMKDKPETAALYLHDIPELQKDPDHYWYKENKKHIEWYLVNADPCLDVLRQEAYTHVIKNIAELKPRTTFLLMSNSPYESPELEIPLAYIPYNLLIPKIYLLHISNNEIKSKTDQPYTEWTKHTKLVDMRDNHMCVPNLELLSELVVESIKTMSVENIKLEKFQTKLITPPLKTLDEFKNYVDAGLLSHALWKEKYF